MARPGSMNSGADVGMSCCAALTMLLQIRSARMVGGKPVALFAQGLMVWIVSSNSRPGTADDVWQPNIWA